ncbi:unnamed protein product [Sphagnum tenellum]
MGKKGKKPRKQEVNTTAQPSPEAAFPGSLAPAPALAGEAMTESSPKQDHPPELGLEDFPPLTPPSVSPGLQQRRNSEVLKWSVNLRGAEGSDGKQFFCNDLFVPMVVGSKVMGMSLREYWEFFCRCINQRNSTAHFANIEALELVVAHSAHAIKLFPDFWTQLPNQCGVIEWIVGIGTCVYEELTFNCFAKTSEWKHMCKAHTYSTHPHLEV